MTTYTDIYRDAIALPSQIKTTPTAADKARVDMFVSSLAHKHGATVIADQSMNTRSRDPLFTIDARDDGYIARNLRTGIVSFYSHADIYTA